MWNYKFPYVSHFIWPSAVRSRLPLDDNLSRGAEAMVPQAILFDLDITLIDRVQSIQRYAACLQRDHADNLVSATVSDIAAAIVVADESGYRPREALFAELIE